MAIRSFHGLTGGLLVGIGFCIISRTLQPDKTFGYLLFIQWGLGGLGLMLLPGLVPVYGVSALFYALMMFTLATSIMLPFLPDYNVDENNNESSKNELPVSKSNIKLLMLSLLAIFLFQGANMGLFAYMIDLGKANNLTIDFMSPSLAMASWIALLGAFVVMVLGNKYGRVLPVVVGTLITALCSWLLHFSGLSMVYAVANIVIGIMWAFVLPFLFGMCSEFDKTGQFAALGGFASKMGLASGPMLAAFLVSNDTYDVVINISTLLLIAATLVALIPARELDRQE